MFTLLASASFLLLARGEYYEKVNQQVSFAAANAKCQEVYGTDLASIHCEADFTSALDICGSSGPCWLGGVHGTISKTGDVTTYEISTDFTTGSWQWMDGAEWDYSNWGVFNEIAQGEGITGEYFTCIWEVWHEENPVGVNDCGTNELFYPICHSPTNQQDEQITAHPPTLNQSKKLMERLQINTMNRLHPTFSP